MITAKHSHSSRSPVFGGTKQLLLSLILTEIAQYLWKVNNCRILKEAWKNLQPTRISGLNKTVIDKSLAWVGKIEIWYFYSSGSKLWISNMKRSCNLSWWGPPGAVRHNYCCLADGLRKKCHLPHMQTSPTYHSYCPTLLLLVQPKPMPVSTEGEQEQDTGPKLTPLKSFQLQHGSNITNMVLLCSSCAGNPGPYGL